MCRSVLAFVENAWMSNSPKPYAAELGEGLLTVEGVSFVARGSSGVFCSHAQSHSFLVQYTVSCRGRRVRGQGEARLRQVLGGRVRPRPIGGVEGLQRRRWNGPRICERERGVQEAGHALDGAQQ